VAEPEPLSIRRAVGLTRAGMLWETLAIALWPLAALAALLLAVLAFGLTDLLGPLALAGVAVLAGLALLAAAVWGLWRFRRPTAEAARARVDLRLPGRPLSALRDRLAIGAGQSGSTALWQAHLARMRADAAAARPVVPDARLRWRDPFGLRLAAMVALAMALCFAPAGQLGRGLAALAASLRPASENRAVLAGGPSWEGWAEPPDYTRRPTLYLNALPEGQRLELPKGSRLSFRLYGDGVAVTQDIGPAIPAGEPAAPGFMAEHDGLVEVAGRRFEVTVLPDAVPVVSPGKAPERRADGKLVQDFTASDDNGIAGGEAVIALDLAAIDRRYGLAAEPEPRADIVVKLPLPAAGTRQQIRGRLTADLSRHAWANLPVTVSLRVEDGIGQQGVSVPLHMVLPGRRFFDPVAAALIELRRDLLWSRANARQSAQVLRAATWQPEGFMDRELHAGLQAGIGTLEAGPLDDGARNRLAQVLWDAAVALEDGGLADALERMQQAQERLSEAIRNGASPDEIARLMQELKQASDQYMDMLAQQQDEDPAQRFDRSPQNRQQISGDQIQKMMDEIQRLMNEGRMAEAQELLEQFNRMMQNLKVTSAEDGSGVRQRPMDRLAQTLREQQKLADEAMRGMQDQYGQWQPDENQPGRDGFGQDQHGQGRETGRSDERSNGPGRDGQEQGGDSGQGLADRQRALREDLGRQRGLLPGRGTAQGDEARRQLDEAGRAMGEAEQALRDGDAAGAMQRQAQAIQSMREGMRALGEMTAQNQPQGQDGAARQGGGESGSEGAASDAAGQRGLAQPYDRQPQTDPLGRALSGEGNAIGGGDPLAEGQDPSRRARELQDEIRRRSGERERPRDERDYLGRLLESF
jgi:uncharacterized protein (TIGR02302 family)